MQSPKMFWKYFQRSSEDYHLQVQSLPNFEILRQMSIILQKPNDVDSSHDKTLLENQNISKPFFKELNALGLAWLNSVAPGFPVDGNKITIIHEPGMFYQTLVEKCQSATRRITMASLYLGTGNLEEKLVSAIDHCMSKSQGHVKLKVLLDFTRGSRGKHNSRTMLLPLLDRYQQSCQVSLYHTPALREPLRSLVPQRYNELVGLQHMKLYLFDDSLLISGANLSNDYFTNRQDRYILIEDCPSLADFYDNLVSRVCEFSLQLDRSNCVHLHEGWALHPYKGNHSKFTKAASEHVWNYYSQAAAQQCTTNFQHTGTDTWIFPLVEMGQLGIHHDSKVTRQLLETAVPHSTICLSTGYFNLTKDYMDSIIQNSSANYNILMAHPSANGFFRAKGPAGGIPAAYTRLAAAFLQHVVSQDQVERVNMVEYSKPGWTFHAKGLWYALPGQQNPSMTLVGSPNFGARSVNRDLETQVAIVTSNPGLQQRLSTEQQRLYGQGAPFTLETASLPERAAPLWVHLVTWLCRNYF